MIRENMFKDRLNMVGLKGNPPVVIFHLTANSLQQFKRIIELNLLLVEL